VKTIWIAIRAVVYASGFIVLWAWLAYWAHLQDPPLGLWLPEWLKPVGVALMALGLVLALSCVATFVVRGRGTPAPFDAPRVFVASGPYRWVRNPMYIGAFLALVGYALCAASVPVLGLALVMILAAHTFVLLYEEPTLEARFGESYLAYKRATPRWIPRPPR
jgi:protein-S-isoprenylcysteine O-methyltransferase Ste14